MTFFNSKSFSNIDHCNKVNKIIKIYQIVINTPYFYSNENFTDNGLKKFGNSLKSLKELKSLSLNFSSYLKNLI